jgi:hypothetical protein
VPAQPGTYTLRYDLVQEGIAWFSGRGMQTPTRSVAVEVMPLGAKYVAPSVFSGGVNAVATVPVVLTNTGSTTWEPGRINLGYHLYLSNGALFVWDGARTALAAPLAPGQSVTITAGVRTPPMPGTYTVKFDMVQEGVTWFSGKGVPMGSATLEVK